MSACVLFLIEHRTLSRRLCVGRVNKDLLESNSVEPAINKHSSWDELCAALESDIENRIRSSTDIERRHVREIFSVYIIFLEPRPAVQQS